MSIIYNEAFFAKKVLLIEGSSDMIMCRYLSNRFSLNLDVAGSQIIPIEGKGQFPVITKLFRLIGKDVCVLTDLDGFTDDNSIVNLFSNLPEATEIANKHGSGALQTMISDYGAFCSCFTQFKIHHLGFDQLLTNSFPLRFFYICLQRFILSGNVVVRIHFLL